MQVSSHVVMGIQTVVHRAGWKKINVSYCEWTKLAILEEKNIHGIPEHLRKSRNVLENTRTFRRTPDRSGEKPNLPGENQNFLEKNNNILKEGRNILKNARIFYRKPGQNVLENTRTFWRKPFWRKAKPYWIKPEHSGLSQDILEKIRTFCKVEHFREDQNFLERTRTFWRIAEHYKELWNIPRNSGTFHISPRMCPFTPSYTTRNYFMLSKSYLQKLLDPLPEGLCPTMSPIPK